MIPAFEGMFNCLINGYIKSHLNTVFVQYSKTTLARQLQEKCQEQNVDLNKAFSTVSRESYVKIDFPGNLSTFIRHLDHCLGKFANLHYFPLTSIVRSYTVTDKAFIAETYVLPIICLSYDYFLPS